MSNIISFALSVFTRRRLLGRFLGSVRERRHRPWAATMFGAVRGASIAVIVAASWSTSRSTSDRQHPKASLFDNARIGWTSSRSHEAPKPAVLARNRRALGIISVALQDTPRQHRRPKPRFTDRCPSVAGAEKIFADKIGGSKPERSEPNKMLNRFRDGDVAIVTKCDRLARSLKDLLEVVETIREHAVGFRSWPKISIRYNDASRQTRVPCLCIHRPVRAGTDFRAYTGRTGVNSQARSARG